MNGWEAISQHPWAWALAGVVWGWAVARVVVACGQAVDVVRRGRGDRG